MCLNNNVKPFIKWAGGKHKIFDKLLNRIPIELMAGDIINYYEPFLGSGALFFKLSQQFRFKNVFLSDINEELILVYKVVQQDVIELINYLEEFKFTYLRLDNHRKEEFYYEMRNTYNISRFTINHKSYSSLWIPRAAQMIFLNKLCYNGLFRQNILGAFNVPFGKNINPEIYERDNLIKISKILENVKISTIDFAISCKDIKDDSFVYLDPPYMPISSTSKFTHYYKNSFSFKDHQRVLDLINRLDLQKVKFMLTNSPSFSDQLIENGILNYNFTFIDTSRMMSSNVEKRGPVKEVIITNY